MAIRRINRIALDGSTVALMFGRHEIPCTKATYGDALEPEVLRYMGSQKQDAQTAGTYKTTDGKVSMDAVIFRTMLYPLFRTDGYGNEKLPITVVYGSPDLGYESDLLDAARFMGLDEADEASSKASEVEFTISFLQLYVGNERKTINTLDMTATPAASKF
jgi:hypothetical protein